MTLRTQLINDLKTFDSEMLSHAQDFIEQLKKKTFRKKNPLLKYAGKLSDRDAKEIQTVIQQEFNSIEGEW